MEGGKKGAGAVWAFKPWKTFRASGSPAAGRRAPGGLCSAGKKRAPVYCLVGGGIPRTAPSLQGPSGGAVRPGNPSGKGPVYGGARSCTELGRQTAERLAFRLAEAGVQVISGLALGIDGAAHKGALEAGGKTFAVLGCGADQCYPRENYGLFKKMELQGGVLSEFVPGTSPLPMNFPMRNRIISGLSDAVILVEAREKSGSLITADLALEQGKEVFAVPGRENVLEAFGIKFEKKTRADKKTEKRLAKNENMVYSFLDSRSGTLEEIMDACGLSVTETMECLLKLELMGMVQGNGDQYYCRKL